MKSRYVLKLMRSGMHVIVAPSDDAHRPQIVSAKVHREVPRSNAA